MVQNVSSSASNAYGSVSRVGTTENGRAIYQVVDPEGSVAGKMTIPIEQVDVFEKSYNDLMETAPKIQKFALENSSEEKIKKRQKTAKWITGLTGAVGAIIPMIKVRGEGWKGTLKQIGLSLLGGVAGLFLGSIIATATTMPSGTRKFSKATQNISKLDIQPYQE